LRKDVEAGGRHNRIGLYCVQKTQLRYDDQQEETGKKAGNKEVLQVVQGLCIAQGIEVV